MQCRAIAVRVVLTCDVGQVEQEQREDCLLFPTADRMQKSSARCHSLRNAPASGPHALNLLHVIICRSGCLRCDTVIPLHFAA